MTSEIKTRIAGGGAAVVGGVLLLGTTGLTLALGWALWAAGLGVVLAAVPAAGERRSGGGYAARRRAA